MPEARRRLSRSRVAFLVAASCVAASFFIGEYPPMVDIPQHAAQVGALDALLHGESAFADEIEVNLLTPYWIGYAPWLLLAQLTSIHSALAFLLAAGFLAFTLLFSKLREALGAAPIADWLSLPSYFGFAYGWGMLTFLLAVPVGFAFLLAVERFRASGAGRDGAIMVLAGVALYLSHILAFAYFCAWSALVLLLGHWRSPRRELARRAWPHFVFAGLLAVYALRDDPLKDTFVYGEGLFEYKDSIGTRLARLLQYPWSADALDASLPFASFLALGAPWIMGLRPSREPARLAPVITALGLWLALPHYAMSTYLVYERFALLLFPAYFLAFDPPLPAATRGGVRTLGAAALVVVVAILTARPLADRVFFARETESFRALVDQLPEGRRALSLVFDRASDVVPTPHVYLHFPQWYAAEKRGFVDFSFAWFHPQMVRFRRAHLPEIAPGFEWVPEHFTALRECDRYDILIVRTRLEPPPDFRAGSTCSHRLAIREGRWFAYLLPEASR